MIQTIWVPVAPREQPPPIRWLEDVKKFNPTTPAMPITDLTMAWVKLNPYCSAIELATGRKINIRWPPAT